MPIDSTIDPFHSAHTQKKRTHILRVVFLSGMQIHLLIFKERRNTKAAIIERSAKKMTFQSKHGHLSLRLDVHFLYFFNQRCPVHFQEFGRSCLDPAGFIQSVFD